jgi:hypothetical protein
VRVPPKTPRPLRYQRLSSHECTSTERTYDSMLIAIVLRIRSALVLYVYENKGNDGDRYGDEQHYAW